ncbi:hypothetical protein [Vibrio harveyi]|uniref:hypothetical protein n=2 Tax=Vibrio harveyi TaxID=669 RepID=UPI003CF03E80
MCNQCCNTPNRMFEIQGNGFTVLFDKEAVNNDKTQLKLVDGDLVISGLADEMVDDIMSDAPPPEAGTILIVELSL